VFYRETQFYVIDVKHFGDIGVPMSFNIG